MKSVVTLYQHVIVHTIQRMTIGLTRCKHGGEGRRLVSVAIASIQEASGAGGTTRKSRVIGTANERENASTKTKARRIPQVAQ